MWWTASSVGGHRTDGCWGWNRVPMEDMCSLGYLKCPCGEGGFGEGVGGRRLSWKFCSFCWQTDVAGYHSSGGKAHAPQWQYSQLQKSQKAPFKWGNYPRGLTASQTQMRALRCGDGRRRYVNLWTISVTGSASGRGDLWGSWASLWLIQRTVTIFQCAETVKNTWPLHTGIAERGRGAVYLGCCGKTESALKVAQVK